MADLFLTRRAKTDLTALPLLVQQAVVETLTWLESDPEGAGKKLRGRLQGLWSCRTGNYRILYTIEGSVRRQRVIVRAIRHRAMAYRSKRKQ